MVAICGSNYFIIVVVVVTIPNGHFLLSGEESVYKKKPAIRSESQSKLECTQFCLCPTSLSSPLSLALT